MSVTGPARGAAAAAAVLVTLALAGCGSGGAPAPSLESRVDVDTPALRAAKRQAGVEPCPDLAASAAATGGLPDVALPCLGGGPAVDLSRVEGPAVVSLWASWCGPCRDELPLFQRLHEQTRGRLTVLGVNFEDVQPDAALRLLRQTKASFPQLADPGGTLAEHYRVVGLPGLLLVDADGQVTFLPRRVDGYRQLAGLVGEHTGVPADRA